MKTRLTILISLMIAALAAFVGMPELYQVSTSNSQVQIKPEFPETTINTKVGPLTLEGLKTSKSEYTSVSSNNSGATSVFTLHNPDRVVLDFFGEDVDKSYSLPVNSNFIKQIRIGKHPNKARVVLDLEPNAILGVKFSSDPKRVDISHK